MFFFIQLYESPYSIYSRFYCCIHYPCSAMYFTVLTLSFQAKQYFYSFSNFNFKVFESVFFHPSFVLGVCMILFISDTFALKTLESWFCFYTWRKSFIEFRRILCSLRRFIPSWTSTLNVFLGSLNFTLIVWHRY